jgi:hypothetical protein
MVIIEGGGPTMSAQQEDTLFNDPQDRITIASTLQRQPCVALRRPYGGILADDVIKIARSIGATQHNPGEHEQFVISIVDIHTPSQAILRLTETQLMEFIGDDI